MISLQLRFEEKITYEPNSGCWLWIASVDHRGYGQFRIKNRTRKAHQVSYELYKHSIPAGLCVLHKCDVPSCVNPNHLFIGTQNDNNRDMMSKGRWIPPPNGIENRNKTRCKHGHPLSGKNLYIQDKTNKRCCRICRNHRQSVYESKKFLTK